MKYEMINPCYWAELKFNWENYIIFIVKLIYIF